MFRWSTHRPEHGELPTHNLLEIEPGLPDEQTTQVWDALNHLVEQRDTASSATTAAPPTLNHIYWTGLGILLAFTTGLLGNLDALTATGSWTIWTAVTITQALTGLIALRITHTRRFAVSWLVALTCALVIAAAYVIISTT